MAKSHPFSTREVLATISSPLRVCLTPWSVFQDGRRYPISSAKVEHHEKETGSLLGSASSFTFAHLTGTSASALVTCAALKSIQDNAWRSVLADEMEVLPLSLSRLQVLCHSLSKVLFKLSLTLLVRYRSSYSVFNFGRQIPAASHCTPKQCYSLGTPL